MCIDKYGVASNDSQDLWGAWIQSSGQGASKECNRKQLKLKRKRRNCAQVKWAACKQTHGTTFEIFLFFFQSLTPMIVFVRSFVCCIYDCLYKHLSVLDCKHFPRWTQRRFHPGTPSDVLRFTFQTYKIYPLTWNQSWIDKYELSSLKVFIYCK